MTPSRAVVLLVLIASAAVISFTSASGPERALGGAGTIVVDTNQNSDADDGLCSLREAIIAANTNAAYKGCDAGVAGTDSISFSLGAQERTISIATELPTISSPMFIDGGEEKIELRGPGGSIVSGDDGLTIDANGDNVFIHNLVINSFRDVGILSYGDNTVLQGNFIGTDVTGTIAMPNRGFGVQIHGPGATIGGSRSANDTCVAPCNLISGNAKAGILLDINSTSAGVFGNFIGTDVSGTSALVPNIPPIGIEVKGDFHGIGGGLAVIPGNACLGGCNVITGGTGIHVFAGADTTSIGNNFLGTDVMGSVALQTSGVGVRNLGHHTFVGGEPNVAGNLISGWGVGVLNNQDLLFVEHNLIGTNFDGTEAIPNVYGVAVDEGQTTLIQNENLISGNEIGVYIINSSGVQIRGNWIGPSLDQLAPTAASVGSIDIGNGVGVTITGASILNSVGQVGDLNEIAYNQNAGILVDGASAIRNVIGANSIHDNGGLGIDNVDGGNAELSPPLITLASDIVATGTACPNCVIQVFSDNDDEGRVYEGMTTADGTGAWAFAAPVGVPLVGPNVTATAMDTLLNTSEFSEPYTIFEPTPTPSPTPTDEPTDTATPTVTPTPTPMGTPTGQQAIWGDNNCSGPPPNPVDALLALRHDAGLSTNTGACPAMGTQVDVVIAALRLWGDIDCSDAVDPVDALKLLRFDAGLSVSQGVGCPGVGAEVTITVS